MSDKEFIKAMIPELERMANRAGIGDVAHFLRMALMESDNPELPPGVGPTGDFPKGKLDPSDEGGMTIAVTSYRGVVRVEFGHPTAWIGLPPEQAVAFATLIVKHAMSIKGHDNDLDPGENERRHV